MNEAVDAKEKLRVLWQDTSSVPEYAAQFKELMARTGYSTADLRDRFYEHLSPRIKDELVHTARPIVALDQLVAVASDIDVRVRQRRAERDRERKRSGVATGTTTTTLQVPPPNAPFVAPAADSNAMEVDATRTREEFMRRMRGRCFGCGSTVHAKKDGSHDRDLCMYCKRVGHREVVCMDKFMGQPKAQKAGAMGDGLSSDDESLTTTPEESEDAKVAATNMTILSQLLEQQKTLADQITALRKQDF